MLICLVSYRYNIPKVYNFLFSVDTIASGLKAMLLSQDDLTEESLSAGIQLPLPKYEKYFIHSLPNPRHCKQRQGGARASR